MNKEEQLEEKIKQIGRLNNIIDEIEAIIYNINLTGIEARTEIQERLNELEKRLNEMKEGKE